MSGLKSPWTALPAILAAAAAAAVVLFDKVTDAQLSTYFKPPTGRPASSRC